jgi:IS6 family transposase
MPRKSGTSGLGRGRRKRTRPRAPRRRPTSPHGGFGGRPHGKGPTPQAPRRAAHPSAKIAGRWVYLYRAIDQFGQVIDVFVSEKRDLAATRRFFTRALEHGPSPIEVTTDRAAAYPRVLDELVPVACHVTEQYANNSGRGRSRTAEVPTATDARPQATPLRTSNQCRARVRPEHRRGHYELGAEEAVNLRVLAAFDELTLAI